MSLYTTHIYKKLDVLVKVSLQYRYNILPKATNILIGTINAFSVTNIVRLFDGSRRWSRHTLPQVSEQDMASLSYVRTSITAPRDIYLNKAVNTLIDNKHIF